MRKKYVTKKKVEKWNIMIFHSYMGGKEKFFFLICNRFHLFFFWKIEKNYLKKFFVMKFIKLVMFKVDFGGDCWEQVFSGFAGLWITVAS
jgi:hypothetical protein